MRGIFAEPRGQRGSGGAAADDDPVVFLINDPQAPA